jgi:hypothetical protein
LANRITESISSFSYLCSILFTKNYNKTIYFSLKCCNQMQSIESDRIASLEQLIKKLTIQINLLAKKMSKIFEVYQSIEVDPNNDIQVACKKYGTCSNEQELYLYDIYAENTKNMMNRDRRIASLTKWADLLTTDIQAQIKSRQGLDKVKSFAKENPNFSNANNDADIGLKLESVNLLKILYEASLYKVQSALAEIFNNQKPSYTHSNLINTNYDSKVCFLKTLNKIAKIYRINFKIHLYKKGVPYSTLKFPCTQESTVLYDKASAPSPPLSPPPPLPIGIIGSVQNGGTISALNPTQISMPVPYSFNPYDASYTGETSSTSSMSTSSISPASIQNSQSSPLFSASQSTNLSKSSYLLTTATSSGAPVHTTGSGGSGASALYGSSISSGGMSSISQGSTQSDHPPSYLVATTLKRNATSNNNNEAHTGGLVHNNTFNGINNNTLVNNKSPKNKSLNNLNQMANENHYNNSAQSSDGKRVKTNFIFIFLVSRLSFSS